MAFQEESALTIGERDVAPTSRVLVQLVRSVSIGLLGPALLGLLICTAAFILADVWLPMGYPIVATNAAFVIIVGLRSVRHRAFFRRLYRTAGRYLPPARLVTLARSGFADPSDGQEREVSILLADLVGFTAFSNRPDLTASEVVGVANQYFTLMHEAIDRHHGCSDKFLGDAVLAFWNGLSDEPDHALRRADDGPGNHQRGEQRRRIEQTSVGGARRRLFREGLCRRPRRQAEKQFHDHRSGGE
jgi:class 3 adenylate cyclase